MRTASTGLDAAVVRLVRRLRARGMRVGADAATAALDAMVAVTLADREDVRLGLHAALLTRPEDAALLDEEFARAWGEVVEAGAAAPPGAPFVDPALAPRAAAPAVAPVTVANWMKGEAADPSGSAELRSPSGTERLSQRDFARWPSVDEQALTRVAARLVRRLTLRRSRRWQRANRGRVDLRATVRAGTRDLGEMVRLVRRQRRVRRTRIVAVCDVSGSMELYTAFLLPFLHALQNTGATVETFLFATRLTRATHAMRGARFRPALRELGQLVRDWSGGTRIGEALAALVRLHPALLDRRTVVLILSDGWEVGDPDHLGEAVRELRRRVGRVIWLNPLMGAPGFAPETRGMQAALPHLDLLAPCHNLAAVEALIPRLAI
ncbi:MAG: VWA domain-containing protein [Gemmatimonadetes bacterium]|nr:VWA domain-containing protein [Gemmatimonadota bacterium]